MALIKGDPEATKKYRAHKVKAYEANRPRREAEARKKAASNAAEAS